MLKNLILGSILLSGLFSGKVIARDITIPKSSELRTANLDTVECLAVNSYHEARSEGDEANKWIMSVVYNRMLDKRYPNTICEVVFQKHQFSWTNDGLSDKIKNSKQYVRLYKLAEEFLMDTKKYLRKSKGVNHYHTVYVKPFWSKHSDMKYLRTIEQHKFYKW